MELKDIKERSREIRAQYEGKYHVMWPDDFKRGVVVLLESGESLSWVCKSTGIAQQTIDRWLPRPKKPKKKNKKFREVIVAERNETGITLHWSESLEVKGLSFGQFTELLERGLL